MAVDSPTPGTETWVSPFPPFGTTPPPCTACGYQHNPLAWCKANVCADCGLGQHAGPDHYDDCPAAPSPVDTTVPPAETQQDDERARYDAQPSDDAWVAVDQWTARAPSVRNSSERRSDFLDGYRAALDAR